MFGFLFSIFGIFTLLIGMLSFLLVPIIPKLTGRFKALARFYMWMMARTLKRGAFSVSEHGDVLLKRMRFDDRGVERMKFDDGHKDFEDPDHARHYWHGIPFAFALEEEGVLFDPRHAAIGAIKQQYTQANQMWYKATESEIAAYDVLAWVRGVFELPRQYQLVDLQAAKYLITGLERSDHPETVETFRKYAEEPYKSGTSATRLLALVVAIVGPFLAVAFVANYFTGAGSAASSSIGFGSSMLAVIGLRGGVPDVSLRDVGAALLVLILVAVPLALIAVFAGPLTALWTALTFLLGFVLVAGLMLLLGQAVGGIPRLMLRMGFMGYDEPVLEWTPQKYRLREYRNLGETAPRPTWYTVAGQKFGATFEPSDESFAESAIPAVDIETRQEVSADGGRASTNLPADSVRFDEQQRAGYLGGFVPKKPNPESIYVDTTVALSAFTHAAVGLKSHRFLTRAKRDNGGQGGIAEKHFVYSTAALAFVSFAAGVGVFFVL